MSRLWSWLGLRARSRPTAAPPRTLRKPARPARRTRLGLEVLEDRLAPSASALPQESWRDQRFRVDDVTLTGPITLDTAQINASNQSFGSMIGLDQVFANTTYRGTGYSVAVIDTGIDYNNPNLGGGFGRRVVAGWDFANNDADPMDDNGHGTHVAGIIGSSNATYSGVAPNVNLIALKVLSADGSGSYGAVNDALNWVIANRTKYNIVAINLSLGSGNYNVNPYDFLESSFSALKSAGVFTAVAAGNNFYTYQGTPGLAFPGVSPSVASVGAVWSGNFGAMAWGSGARDNTTAVDRVASFSQRSSGLSIMAPGAMITSTVLRNGFEAMAGTSMASPVIAGAAALLHQALDAAGKGNLATQDGILGIMKSTGVQVVDGDDENDNVANTGFAFKRINLAAAMNSVGQTAPPTNGVPILAAIANQSVAAGGSVSVTLSATDPNNDPLTFSARVVGVAADSSKAYQLRQSLGLYALSSYFVNSFGMNEKWLGGSGNAYYVVLPSGEVRRFAGTAAATMTAGNLVGTLDASYYNDPTLLLNAQPGTAAPIATSLAGNRLTVSTTPAATGSYVVEVAASDGKATATRTFTVSIAAPSTPPRVNAAPTLSIANLITAPIGARGVAIPFRASDADGDRLTITAQVNASGSSQASQLKATYGLTYAGSYFLNAYGKNEKWLKSSDGLTFYCLLPNGELHKFTGTVASLTSPSTLLAKLDASFYADPSKLWNAPPPGPVATATIVNDRVVVTLAQPYRGSFTVEISVSDGAVTVKKTVTVTFP